MFHRLRVSQVEHLTDDAVAITFDVPPELRTTFRHLPGQHVTLRRPSTPLQDAPEHAAEQPPLPPPPGALPVEAGASHQRAGSALPPNASVPRRPTDPFHPPRPSGTVSTSLVEAAIGTAGPTPQEATRLRPTTADAPTHSGQDAAATHSGSARAVAVATPPPAEYTASRAADDTSRPLAPEVRRTYSVCCPPSPGTALRVGVRQVVGGEFSTYAVKELAVGDLLDVMAPTGRFVLSPQPGHFAAVVGGSGITPVLSMATTLLAEEPSARFTLVRSDRSSGSAMFLEEVAELKDRYPDRFHLVHVLTREELQAGPVSGRLDEARLTTLLPALLTVSAVDGWYLCGPLGLVQSATSALLGLGVPRHLVHQEIFHAEETDTDPAAGRATDTATTGTPSREDRETPPSTPLRSTPLDATLTGTLHGRSGTWPSGRSETVLETVLRHRPDAPYACRGGVCGTCRALLVDGEVHMARDFALEPGEVSAGYVLTCQSRPVTTHVEVDFDR